MLVIQAKERMKEVLDFATENDCIEAFLNRLIYLSYSPDGNTRCILHHDFAPLSFAFVMERMRANERKWNFIYNGGLLYSGPGVPLNGSYPSLSVSLNADAAAGKIHMWSVHT